MLANPKNCEMVTLAHDGLGRLKLDGRCELKLSELAENTRKEIIEGDDNDVGGREGRDAKANGKEDDGKETKVSKTTATTTVVTGYKKHSRLRTLPPQYVRHRTVRMCYDDT